MLALADQALRCATVTESEIVCFGGPLHGRRLILEAHVNYIEAPEPPEPTLIFDPNPDLVPLGIRTIMYRRNKWLARFPHPCIRGAMLWATWWFLAIKLPSDPFERRRLVRLVVEKPPHSGWRMDEEHPAASPSWWFHEVYRERADNKPRPKVRPWTNTY